MKATPNFLVIGAARSGTTLLHAYLLQHPDIYVPISKQPEPHYFLKTKNYEMGEHWYHQTFFSDVKSELAIGEISTSYLFGEAVPERIKEYNPDMKFVVMLREPVDRAYSNYWHSCKNGLEDLDFREASKNEYQRHKNLDREIREIAPYSYIGRSLYAEQLKRYLYYFSKNQFCLILFEDFISEPRLSLEKICDFLGVDKGFSFDLVFEDMNRSRPKGIELQDDLRKELSSNFIEDINELKVLFDLDLDKWNR